MINCYIKNISILFLSFLIVISGCSTPNTIPIVKPSFDNNKFIKDITELNKNSQISKSFSTKATAINTISTNIQNSIYYNSYYSGSGVYVSSSGDTLHCSGSQCEARGYTDGKNSGSTSNNLTGQLSFSGVSEGEINVALPSLSFMGYKSGKIFVKTGDSINIPLSAVSYLGFTPLSGSVTLSIESKNATTGIIRVKATGLKTPTIRDYSFPWGPQDAYYSYSMDSIEAYNTFEFTKISVQAEDSLIGNDPTVNINRTRIFGGPVSGETLPWTMNIAGKKTYNFDTWPEINSNITDLKSGVYTAEAYYIDAPEYKAKVDITVKNIPNPNATPIPEPTCNNDINCIPCHPLMTCTVSGPIPSSPSSQSSSNTNPSDSSNPNPNESPSNNPSNPPSPSLYPSPYNSSIPNPNPIPSNTPIQTSSPSQLTTPIPNATITPSPSPSCPADIVCGVLVTPKPSSPTTPTPQSSSTNDPNGSPSNNPPSPSSYPSPYNSSSPNPSHNPTPRASNTPLPTPTPTPRCKNKPFSINTDKNIFTPNDDGKRDTLGINIKACGNWNIKIEPTNLSQVNILNFNNNDLIKTFSGADNQDIVWDGKNNAGYKLPTKYIVKVTDENGRTAQKEIELRADNTIYQEDIIDVNNLYSGLGDGNMTISSIKNNNPFSILSESPISIPQNVNISACGGNISLASFFSVYGDVPFLTLIDKISTNGLVSSLSGKIIVTSLATRREVFSQAFTVNKAPVLPAYTSSDPTTIKAANAYDTKHYNVGFVTKKIWDAKDNNGNVVPEGLYSYTTNATLTYTGGRMTRSVKSENTAQIKITKNEKIYEQSNGDERVNRLINHFRGFNYEGGEVVSVGFIYPKPFRSGDIDIVLTGNRYLEVGGPAKNIRDSNGQPSKFLNQLDKLIKYSEATNGIPYFYYDKKTPQDLIDIAKRKIGNENVIEIPCN